MPRCLLPTFVRRMAAFPVDEVPEEVLKELESLDTYEESKEILSKVMKATNNPLNEVEQGYALLHINNLIAQFKQSGEWHTAREN